MTAAGCGRHVMTDVAVRRGGRLSGSSGLLSLAAYSVYTDVHLVTLVYGDCTS
jgi:hypothetical protein